MSVYDVLVEIKERLGGVKVKTLKIGIEPTLSPSDYPIVRIVAGDNELNNLFDGYEENISFSVYAGFKIDEKAGVESIYKALYTLENEVKTKLHNEQLNSGGLIRFVSTKSDEDRLKNFKVLCLNFTIKGVRLG